MLQLTLLNIEGIAYFSLDRVSVFVGCSDKNDDDQEWSVRLACALKDLGFATELVCVATFENFLDKLNASLEATHYIPVFSLSGFSDCLTDIDQLDTIIDQLLRSNKPVLPVARGGLTWDKLRATHSSFSQCPHEIAANEDITDSALATARKFFLHIKQNGMFCHMYRMYCFP